LLVPKKVQAAGGRRRIFAACAIERAQQQAERVDAVGSSVPT
jgi:hypothetical protein